MVGSADRIILVSFSRLVRINRKEERDFYEQEAIKSNWGIES